MMHIAMPFSLTVSVAYGLAATEWWGSKKQRLSLAKPEGIAQTFLKVEHSWEELAIAIADCGHDALPNCTLNSTNAQDKFVKSCSTVTRAVIQSSAGDKTRVQSYMAYICGQDGVTGNKAVLCLDYAKMLADELSEYQHDNTGEGLDVQEMCLRFLQNGYLGEQISDEAERLHRQAEARDEAKKQQEEEMAKQQMQAEAEAKEAAAVQQWEAFKNATVEADAKREEATRAFVEAERRADEIRQADALAMRLNQEAIAANHSAMDAAANLSRHFVVANVSGPHSTSQTVNVPSSFFAVSKSFRANYPIAFA